MQSIKTQTSVLNEKEPSNQLEIIQTNKSPLKVLNFQMNFADKAYGV